MTQTEHSAMRVNQRQLTWSCGVRKWSLRRKEGWKIKWQVEWVSQAGGAECKNVFRKARTRSFLVIEKYQCGCNIEWGGHGKGVWLITIKDQNHAETFRLHLEGNEKSLQGFTHIRKVTQFSVWITDCKSKAGGRQMNREVIAVLQMRKMVV